MDRSSRSILAVSLGIILLAVWPLGAQQTPRRGGVLRAGGPTGTGRR